MIHLHVRTRNHSHASKSFAHSHKKSLSLKDHKAEKRNELNHNWIHKKKLVFYSSEIQRNDATLYSRHVSPTYIYQNNRRIPVLSSLVRNNYCEVILRRKREPPSHLCTVSLTSAFSYWLIKLTCRDVLNLRSNTIPSRQRTEDSFVYNESEPTNAEDSSRPFQLNVLPS